jgi:hypothetical protein
MISSRHRLTVLILIATTCCFGQTAPISFDTSRTAIIPLEKCFVHVFDNNYVQAMLTQSDILEIDTLFNESFADYNSHLSEAEKKYLAIDQKNRYYRRQYVCVLNNEGQKEVYLNCFCAFIRADWRKSLIVVKDGGSCFFNFKINLAKRKYYSFFVNGFA